jgi:hippurate hydrolase
MSQGHKLIVVPPAVHDSMIAHRRHLHANPEVGIQLPKTHDYIAQVLESLGLVTEIVLGGGVTTRISGSNPKLKPIIFRADMDALPVLEDVDLDYCSKNRGAMHACGHDLHMATLLGVAQDLITNPPMRDVILAFQPGEESDRGAKEVLKNKNLQIDDAETFAIHVNAVLPSGQVSFSRNVFMAFGDWFSLEIEGPGGHASAPERAGNPIQFGSIFEEGLVRIAKELSTEGSRVVATVTEFISGNTVNVIPTTGSLRGTIRTVSVEQREQLHSLMHGLVKDLADSLDLSARLTITEGYPAVVSDIEFIESLLDTARKNGYESKLHEMDEPSMVIEDYSYFLHKWPGAMVYVGAAIGDQPAFNHSASAQFDEKAMDTAFSLFRMLAPADPKLG